MRRIQQLVRAGRLDGFTLMVDAPAEAHYPGLAIPARETARLTFWVGSRSTERGEGDADWLSPGHLLWDRPSNGTRLGDWAASMHRRAAEEGKRLVVLEPR